MIFGRYEYALLLRPIGFMENGGNVAHLSTIGGSVKCLYAVSSFFVHAHQYTVLNGCRAAVGG